VLDRGLLRGENKSMSSFPVKAKKCGRPKGTQYDATIHVRLPSPAVNALARLAAAENVAVADLVRGSIASLLNGAAPQMAEVARNEKAGPAARGGWSRLGSCRTGRRPACRTSAWRASEPAGT